MTKGVYTRDRWGSTDFYPEATRKREIHRCNVRIFFSACWALLVVVNIAFIFPIFPIFLWPHLTTVYRCNSIVYLCPMLAISTNFQMKLTHSLASCWCYVYLKFSWDLLDDFEQPLSLAAQYSAINLSATYSVLFGHHFMLFGHIFACFSHIFCAFRPHILCSLGSNHHVLELLDLFRQVFIGLSGFLRKIYNVWTWYSELTQPNLRQLFLTNITNTSAANTAYAELT
jgi:hypothetical protein